MVNHKKLRTPKIKYWAILLLASGLLILIYESNVTAETVIPRKESPLDIIKTPLKLDRMNLVDRLDLLEESQNPPSNLIRKSDNIEQSKETYTILIEYIVLAFLACFFVFVLIYIIRDHMVLSRDKWIQRYAVPKYEYPSDSLSNTSLQTNAKSTSNKKNFPPSH